MDSMTEKRYTKPTVEDLGDLIALTAQQHDGEQTDANFPIHTPKKSLTFS